MAPPKTFSVPLALCLLCTHSGDSAWLAMGLLSAVTWPNSPNMGRLRSTACHACALQFWVLSRHFDDQCSLKHRACVCMLVRAGMRSPKPAVLTQDLHISHPKHACSSGPTGPHGFTRLRRGEDLRCRQGTVLMGASRGLKPCTFGLHDISNRSVTRVSFPPFFADF